MKRSRISTEKELGEALKEGVDTIEIEGDLRKKVLKIKGTGKVSWAIAIGCIVIALTGILVSPATAGATGAAGFIAAPAAVAALGAPVATSAILIAIAAGGVGALNRLRKYKIVSNEGDRLVLKK